MEQYNEKSFFEELKNVPELPGDIYPEVESRVGSPRKKSHWIALAASLLLVTSITITTRITRHSENTYTLDEEIISELQLVHDYFNAYDIEEDYDFTLSTQW